MENTRFGQNGSAMAMDKNHHLNGDHVATARPRAGAYEDRTDNQLMALIAAGASGIRILDRCSSSVYHNSGRATFDREFR